MAKEDSFQIRWRGKVSGPHRIKQIEEMLARGDISLLHEALVGGHWLSLDEVIRKVQKPENIKPTILAPEPAPKGPGVLISGSPDGVRPQHRPTAPPPIPADDLFYVAKGGQQQGPYTKSAIRQLAAAGVLSTDDLAWKEGMPDWMALLRLMPDLPRVTVAPPVAPTRGADHPQQVSPTAAESGGSGAVVGGYVCAVISLLLFPPFFSLAAFICGIVALVKGNVGHGIAIILLSLVCGFLGMAFGAAAFS